MRLGALRAIDLRDLRPDDDAVALVHRPETDTLLKNGLEGERWVWLSEPLFELVEEYIDVHRDDVTDDHGREPLLTT